MVASVLVIWSQENQLLPAPGMWQPAAVRVRRWPAERREARGVYDRRGRFLACPLDRSAEEHHPCTTFLRAAKSSPSGGPAGHPPRIAEHAAAVSSVSTTTSRPRSSASADAGRCRQSRIGTRPTACPKATAGPPGTSPSPPSAV